MYNRSLHFETESWKVDCKMQIAYSDFKKNQISR